MREFHRGEKTRKKQSNEMKRRNVIDLTVNSDEEIEEIDLVLLY